MLTLRKVKHLARNDSLSRDSSTMSRKSSIINNAIRDIYQFKKKDSTHSSDRSRAKKPNVTHFRRLSSATAKSLSGSQRSFTLKPAPKPLPKDINLSSNQPSESTYDILMKVQPQKPQITISERPKKVMSVPPLTTSSLSIQAMQTSVNKNTSLVLPSISPVNTANSERIVKTKKKKLTQKEEPITPRQGKRKSKDANAIQIQKKAKSTRSAQKI